MDPSSLSTKPDVTLSLNILPSICRLKPHERSVKLIELLLTCAKQASSGNLQHADACLRRISDMASVTGDSMQRLAVRFASALAARLVKRWPGLYKALNNNNGPDICNMDRARSIFNGSFPFMIAIYPIISRSLVQAMSMERSIHIIDLGPGDSKLWASFLRGIADGPDGPPCLRISCVDRNKEAQEILKGELVKEAENLQIPFEFNPVNASIKELMIEMFNIKPDEAVAIVSISSLHVLLAEDDRVDARFGLSKSNEVKECRRMNDFFEMVKLIHPKIMLLVEQESNHNLNRLVDRFVEALRFYSALFDSIDCAFGGMHCTDRTALEEMFGKEIENIVAGEGLEREKRHERLSKWVVRFGRAGFRPIRLWCETERMDEAQKVLEMYGPQGLKIMNTKGCLMICWHDRPIYALSGYGLF